MDGAPPGARRVRPTSDEGARHGVVDGLVPHFARTLRRADLPGDVVHQAQRCLLDLIGVAAAGSLTRSAQLATAYAADQMGGTSRSARMLFDGRRAGLAGAAYAGASTIDAIEAKTVLDRGCRRPRSGRQACG